MYDKALAMSDGQRNEKLEMFTLHKTVFILLACSLIYKYYTSTTPSVVRVKEPKFSILGPYNTTQILFQDNYSQLININNFEFKINPKPCKDYPSGLLLMVIVSSNPINYDKRKAIRQTWGRHLDSTKLLFLLGESENITLSEQILAESKKYGDMVQGSFIDAYRNMTYKHVMGLKWVSHHCPTAKYVLKTDDDVLVNGHELRHFLARELSPWGVKDLIMCPVLEHQPAHRTKSKWKVTKDEYSPQYYPTYCAGWVIIYSQDVVGRLLTVAQKHPYFWIDDVHITGVMAEKIGLAHTPISSLILSYPILSYENMRLRSLFGPKFSPTFVFGPPDLSVSKMVQIWRAIPE